MDKRQDPGSSSTPAGRKQDTDPILITEAPLSPRAELDYRRKRYAITMGIRVICFAIAIILFVAHLRWLVLVPAVGAIFIPYIAVVFANGGREPDNVRGFMEHRMNLPAKRDPSDDDR